MAIVVPGPGRVLGGIFGKNNDYLIDWHDIVRIGTDAILVNVDIFN